MTDEELLTEEERLRAQQPIADPPPYGFRVAIADPPAIPLEPRPPVWAGSSASDIDAANAAAPQTRSYAESGMPASSFINADVGPTGNVISGSYDSTEDDLRAMKAHEAAIRYKGLQTYRSLISGGATPAEAYRLAGPDLNFSDPAAAVKMESLMKKKAPVVNPAQISGTPIKDPATGHIIGHAVLDPVTGRIHTVSVSKPTQPGADVRAAQQLKLREIDDARKNIARDMTIYGKEKDPDAARRIVAERERLANLEKEYQAGSTNWMASAASAPAPAGISAPALPSPTFVQKSPEGFVMVGDPDRPAAAVTTRTPEGITIAKPDDKVVVVKEGKRYRLPKAQLADALKEGFKLE